MSVTTSGENLASDSQSCDGGSMCLELALEGERLCKAGDCRAGVAFFQAAIQAGTDDLRTLSAIYSQLGNAYFYLCDYNKAMHFHKLDLTLARTMGDKLGEAKASGNLGNTLKVMGKFNEAIQCCRRHLDISRELGDRLSEGRALYNLGNVFHAQGKQLGRVGQNDPGHFPQEVRECLNQAVTFYKENLELMSSIGDRQAMGRACGNLGNTCYLLGDFSAAIVYHKERLKIAKEFGDRAAERRANSNLANSHIFLGQFENAAEHYKRTLGLAEELGDAAVEAQACYSLGNTYTLLREYRTAEEYHARHLAAARNLHDRIGEGRACWSLGNAHAALGNHEKALYFATEHYTISKELGDVLGTATAQMNIADLRKVLGLPDSEALPSLSHGEDHDNVSTHTPFSALRVRRQSMEQLSLIQITPDAKKREVAMEVEGAGAGGTAAAAAAAGRGELTHLESEDTPESFFELLTRCQSARMEDQRCTLADVSRSKVKPPKLQRSVSGGVAIEPTRNDSQRAVLIGDEGHEGSASGSAVKKGKKLKGGSSLPGMDGLHTSDKTENDFLELLARMQGARLEDQRSELPAQPPPPPPQQTHRQASTVPDDDFFNVLMRVQAGRMEDQRATIPIPVPDNRGKEGSNPKK